MTNETYLISGTRAELGAIGAPENFQEEITAPSSREAYIAFRNRQENYERVHVVAIKMRCTHCGKSHVTVDPGLYLY